MITNCSVLCTPAILKTFSIPLFSSNIGFLLMFLAGSQVQNLLPGKPARISTPFCALASIYRLSKNIKQTTCKSKTVMLYIGIFSCTDFEKKKICRVTSAIPHSKSVLLICTFYTQHSHFYAPPRTNGHRSDHFTNGQIILLLSCA